MITLYDYELSGNCYKLRLLLSFLQIEYKTVPVEFYPGREHKSEWFLTHVHKALALSDELSYSRECRARKALARPHRHIVVLISSPKRAITAMISVKR